MDLETPEFRELYELLWEPKEVWYSEVLPAWLPKARQAIEALAPFRKRNSASNPYPILESNVWERNRRRLDPSSIDHSDLWQWYAFSRVKDRLLTKFPRGHGRYPVKWRQECQEEYVALFESLGFRAFSDYPFHPFYHEIVEVEEDSSLHPGEIMVAYVYWPGLMFGNMMFSRSGAGVLCYPGVLKKHIAEKSTLYFTYLREGRKTEDLSLGWGHNSQWGTDFRRDYEEDGVYQFNVDGKCRLDEGYEASLSPLRRMHLDDLTMNERIELLIHRCFVTCEKDDANRWPYEDTYSMPRQAT